MENRIQIKYKKMITIIKKVYLVFYRIVEEILQILIVVINLIVKIVKIVANAVESFFDTIFILRNFFKRFFLFLPSNISKTTFLLSSKNDNQENFNDKAPPVFKF